MAPTTAFIDASALPAEALTPAAPGKALPPVPVAAPGKLTRRARAHLVHWLATEHRWSMPKAHAAVKAYVSWMRRVAADRRAGRLAADAVPAPPSSTVATVWAVHVLYTPEYAAFCATATGGGFIPHQPAELPGLPQLAPGEAGFARLADGSVALSAAMRARLSACLCAEHGWSAATAEQHVAEYEAWWRATVVPLVAGAPAGGITSGPAPPSFEVDDVWHAHVQHTAAYAAWCGALGEAAFVHHCPKVLWQVGLPAHVRRPDRRAERELSMVAIMLGGISTIIIVSK